ncbi:beta-N-acetylhexosaminidase [Specibacter sp. RAF43]|uniref:beta-N-acetylhexosaminidase n=1 Tax=Specibacter sp. RAF43 TaxID=3233057 RepID=UPI003F954628
MTSIGPSLLPHPRSVNPGRGEFRLTAATGIFAPPELEAAAFWLQGALRPATGFPVAFDAGRPGGIVLSLDAALAPEAYRLSVSGDGVALAGGDAAGVFYGCQTLCQLLPSEIYRQAVVAGAHWCAPAVVVEDAPRFGWRGAMLDVARHFLPKREVLRFLDLMALHRLNTLHLHLTDDQGWRLEILRYPRLTEVGGWRRESQVGAGEDAPSDGRPHGGFYTQEDIREIVAYARARFITVVPEIDTPGHVQAALAAYPELGVTGATLEVFTRWGINPNVLNAQESTVDFFRNVFDEVMDLFPSHYIGVGGDECPREQWANDPRSRERLSELGLGEPAELQAWFIERLDAHMAARGRRILGWDEILEGRLSRTSVVASWRGMAGAVAAARRGHDVICCPDDLAYLDYRQSELPTEPIPVSIALTVADIYAFNPVPDSLTPAQKRHILGGQANLWTEHIDSPRTLDYQAFPRLCAMAEVLWGNVGRDFGDFSARLEDHLARLRAVGVEYRPAAGPLPWQQRPGVPGRPETRDQRAAHIAALVTTITG